jgi:hypothetical protein
VLIRYARACWKHDQVMSQGFLQSRLQAVFFCNFYGRYNDLVCQYNLPLGQIGQMLSDVFYISRQAFFDALILTTVRTIYPKCKFRAHGGCGRSTEVPRDLIPPLVYPEVRVCTILKFVFPT